MKLEQLLTRLARVEEAVFEALAPKRQVDFSGRWKNEFGSIMDIHVAGATVTGTYTSMVSSAGGAIRGPIIGTTTGDIISFTVLWPSEPAKITAWVGQLVVTAGSSSSQTERLETLWQMIVNEPDAQDPDSLWTTIHAGADHFWRIGETGE